MTSALARSFSSQRVERVLARVERLTVAQRLPGGLVEDVEARLGGRLRLTAGRVLGERVKPSPMPTSVHFDACVTAAWRPLIG